MLPPEVYDKIDEYIDALYDAAKARLLGGKFSKRGIRVKTNHQLSITGIFDTSSIIHKAPPNREDRDRFISVIDGYIEAYRHRAKARFRSQLDSIFKNQEFGGTSASFQAVNDAVQSFSEEISSEMSRLVETEVGTARNMGALDGVMKAGAAFGISDPTVFFAVVKDEHMCEECARLHLLEDRITPRVWKMSEIEHSYHKKGEDSPKVSGLHPHCRCQLVSLMPGYGFSGTGHVRYVSPDYDEYSIQRSPQ